MSGREAFAAQINVSRETLERLETYAVLLKKWNPAINLVSRSTIPDLWSRHFLDSAQILELAPEGTKSWADLGTGGGFPGLIVAILAAETQPDLVMTCIESDQRKATFLRTVARETGVTVNILSQRIEAAQPVGADVLSARALAPLKDLFEMAERHLKPGGTALFPKGINWQAELSESLESWAFKADTYPSRTDPDAVILKIGDIARV